MTGTLVNFMAIIAGSFAGIFFKKGISEKYKETVMHGIALSVLLIGLKGALVSDALLLVIASVVIGSILGEMIGIEDYLERLGRWIEGQMPGSADGVAKGFVTASLVFCVGSMAIVGALESGLTGNHQTLFAKSILDGITSIIFTSTMGIGVLFSSIPVLLYQGGITIGASFMKDLLTPEVIAQMTSVGGLLIMAIGINILEVAKIRVGNMLPAIFIPLVYFLGKSLFI